MNQMVSQCWWILNDGPGRSFIMFHLGHQFPSPGKLLLTTQVLVPTHLNFLTVNHPIKVKEVNLNRQLVMVTKGDIMANTSHPTIPVLPNLDINGVN